MNPFHPSMYWAKDECSIVELRDLGVKEGKFLTLAQQISVKSQIINNFGFGVLWIMVIWTTNKAGTETRLSTSHYLGGFQTRFL